MVLLGFLDWEKHRRDTGQAALLDPGDPAGPAAAQRAHRVLLPVPAPGRPVLRGAAVPLDRARALGHRHRRADPAAVDHAGDRRRRHPQAVPAGVAPAGVASSGSSCCSSVWSCSSPRSTPGPAPRSSPGRCSSPGSASARSASQLGAVTVSALPDEQSGEVGGLQNTFSNLGISIGTALAGRGPHVRAHRVVLLRHREQPGGARRTSPRRRRPSSRAACRSSPTPTSRARSTTPGCRATTADRHRRRERRGPPRRRCARRSACSRVLALVALFLSGSIPTTPVGVDADDATPADHTT